MDKIPLSPSRRHLTVLDAERLGGVFAAAILKANPFSDEAQDLIENHWGQIQVKAKVALVNALNSILKSNRFTITVRVKVKRGQTREQIFLCLLLPAQ